MVQGIAYPNAAITPQTVVETLTILLGVALLVALISRGLRFPYTLALAVVGLALGLAHLLPQVQLRPDVVLFIFIPTILFEGAWNMDVTALRANWLIIALLAVPGLLIAVAISAITLVAGARMNLLEAVVLSAIVAPTDPIAVIALLRSLGMSSRLRTIIEGESLFNDGVGAAVFTISLSVLITQLAGGSSGSSSTLVSLAGQALWLFLGGPLIGGVVGFAVSRALRHIEDRLIETAATFVTAYAVYLVADLVKASGLLAVVTAGLMLGSYGRRVGISEQSHDPADNVWEFLSYAMTSLLFLLLGIQIGGAFYVGALPAILWTTLGVIVGRIIIVYGAMIPHDALARHLQRSHVRHRARGRPLPISPGWRPLVVLSGLRGALSLALALSLPANVPQRGLIQSTVYGVVLVTLLGQGIGMRLVLPHWPNLREGDKPSPSGKPNATPGPTSGQTSGPTSGAAARDQAPDAPGASRSGAAGAGQTHAKPSA